MTEEIIIAGFGGMGVLAMGKIMAYSAIMQGKEVSWIPSYGPEMRGGTANVIVILGDEKISSPIVKSCDTAIVLNQPSLDKFEESVKPGGMLIFDDNCMNRNPKRKDIRIFKVSAALEASKMSSSRIFNMIVLGAYLKANPILTFDSVKEGLRKSLNERHHHLLGMNEEAIKRGMAIVEQVQ